MAFGQAQTEQPLHHGREVHPVEPCQPSGQLSVVERRWPHADLGQTRQILVGGVQDPFVRVEHLGDGPQHRHRVTAVADRIDQYGAGAVPPDLDQIGPIRVAKPRGAFGVDSERPVAGAQQLGGCGDLGGAD